MGPPQPLQPAAFPALQRACLLATLGDINGQGGPATAAQAQALAAALLPPPGGVPQPAAGVTQAATKLVQAMAALSSGAPLPPGVAPVHNRTSHAYATHTQLTQGSIPTALSDADPELQAAMQAALPWVCATGFQPEPPGNGGARQGGGGASQGGRGDSPGGRGRHPGGHSGGRSGPTRKRPRRPTQALPTQPQPAQQLQLAPAAAAQQALPPAAPPAFEGHVF